MPIHPKISVIVPVYNTAVYLSQCMDSILSQTLEDLEIILVDDGSTDASGKICDCYAEKDSRVNVIHQTNGGYGKAMNRGILSALGEYIGIVEPDDFIKPDMFAYLYESAIRHDADIVKSNFYRYWSKPAEHIEPAAILRHFPYDRLIDPDTYPLILDIMPSIWSAIYRAAYLRENAIHFLETPGAAFQDTSFTFKVMACSRRIVFIDRFFLYYRQDNDNSSVNSPGKAFCVCDEYREIERFLSQCTEREKKFRDVKNKAKFSSYIWNYERLSPSLKKIFLKQFHKELAAEENILKNRLLDKQEKHILERILATPDEYYLDSIRPFRWLEYSKYKILSKLSFGKTRQDYHRKYLQQKKARLVK